MNPFIEAPETKELVKELKEKKLDQKAYSDIVDDSGNQYVDLVQEGGGMLGIALAGYTFMLEQAGIRFFSLAGTSAGAINTMMIAGMGKIGTPVSEKILDMLSSKNLFDLVDGPPRLKKLTERILKKKRRVIVNTILNMCLIYKTAKNKLGMNPGQDFEDWIDEYMELEGISQMADLVALRKDIPKLKDRLTGEELQREAGLKIITSDVTTKSKICFPEMAELYWAEPDRAKPSAFVRASMSVPFFFEPMEVKNIPNAGQTEDPNLPKEKTKWRKHTGYHGKIPASAHFVDGGMLSNFPINAFHRSSGAPKKPTFGARLSTWRDQYSNTGNLMGFCGAMISTMRQLHDYDFLLRHPDYKQLICSIDADAKKDEEGNPMFFWLDFNMPQEKQIALFQLGAKKALGFLESFSWEQYKETREKIAQQSL